MNFSYQNFLAVLREFPGKKKKSSFSPADTAWALNLDAYMLKASRALDIPTGRGFKVLHSL